MAKQLKVKAYTTDPISAFMSCASNVFTLPFKLYYDNERGVFSYGSSKLQLGLCTFIYMLASFGTIHEVYQIANTGLVSGDPIQYFNLATNIADIVCFVVPCYLYYSKGFQLTELLNLLHRSDSLISAPFRKNQEKKNAAFTSTFIAVAIFNFSVRIFERIQKANWDSEAIWDQFSMGGMGLFFISPVERSSAWRIPGIIVYMVQRVSSSVFWTLADWFPVISVISMHSIVVDFSKMVSQDSTSISEVLEYYEEMKLYFKKYNDTMGLQTFSGCLIMLPYYISHFVVLLRPGGMPAFIRTLLDFNILFLFMSISVVVNIKGRKSLELFLSQKNRYLKIPSQQLQSLYYEASSGTLAMEGLGLFKITSGFLGSMVSLIITFAVIILQFQADAPKNNCE